MKYFIEAANTIEAGWIELELAKMFGKKHTGKDESIGKFITLSTWRGKTYLIDTEDLTQNNQK